MTFKNAYRRGASVLKAVLWRTDPAAPFQQPQRTQKIPLGIRTYQSAQHYQVPFGTMWDAVMLAARIEHLVAVYGESARKPLVHTPQLLTSTEIAELCRLEPDETRIRLETLLQGQAGSTDSQPQSATS